MTTTLIPHSNYVFILPNAGSKFNEVYSHARGLFTRLCSLSGIMKRSKAAGEVIKRKLYELLHAYTCN